MSKINVAKVIPAGLLAGIVLAIFSYVSDNFLLAEQWQTVAQLRNLDLMLMGGTPALITSVITNLLVGMIVALTYAAIRPRFGKGPGTAAIAAFFIFVPQALLLAGMSGWFLPWELFFRQSVVMLVAMVGAAFAADWIYSEEGDPVD